jgi:GntR family transcriptional repressor for pyruvate dehydrogenase complex
MEIFETSGYCFNSFGIKDQKVSIMLFKRANKSTLYEDVLYQVLDAVKRGTWKPGGKIPGELALTEHLQVSRNCIEIALEALSILKIVEARPGQVTFVAKDALRQITNRELA